MVSEEQILLGVASDRRPVPLVGGLGSDGRFYYAIYYAIYYATMAENGNPSGFNRLFYYAIYYAIPAKKLDFLTAIFPISPFPSF